jgi:hypothetical protein
MINIETLKHAVYGSDKGRGGVMSTAPMLQEYYLKAAEDLLQHMETKLVNAIENKESKDKRRAHRRNIEEVKDIIKHIENKIAGGSNE